MTPLFSESVCILSKTTLNIYAHYSLQLFITGHFFKFLSNKLEQSFTYLRNEGNEVKKNQSVHSKLAIVDYVFLIIML